MALLTVNELPLSSGVDRSLGNVYRWYQTAELTFPFDPISPIDHGYFILSFETGPVSDGFSPEPDADGWVQIEETNFPPDLLEAELETSRVLTVSGSSPEKTLSSDSVTVGLSKTPDHYFHDSSFSIGREIDYQYSTGSSFEFLNREKDHQFSEASSFISSYQKELVISEPLVTDTHYQKEVFGSSSLLTDFKKKEKNINYSLPIQIDVTSPEFTYSSELTIDITTREDIFSDSVSASIVGEEKSITASVALTIDTTSLESTFSAIVSTTFQPLDKELEYSSGIGIDVGGEKQLELSEVTSVDVVSEVKVETFSSTHIDLSWTNGKKNFYAGTRSFNIGKGEPFVGTSSPIATSINAGDRTYAFSNALVTEFVTAQGYKAIKYSPVGTSTINAGDKLFSYADVSTIDIAFTGEVRVLDDQEWFMLKRFGTRGWKFLSYLEYFDTTTIANDLTIDVDTNFGTFALPSEMMEVITDPQDDTKLDRIIYYSDATKTDILEEMLITYSGNLPSKVTINTYNEQRILSRRIEEDFTITQPQGDLVSTGFIVTNFNTEGRTVLPIADSQLIGQTTTLEVGDAVYTNFEGGIVPCDATALSTSRAVGFISSIQDNSAVVLQYGVLEVFSGLTPGVNYFLDPLNEGKITTTVPAVGSKQVLKKVGRALNATTLIVDLTQPAVFKT